MTLFNLFEPSDKKQLPIPVVVNYVKLLESEKQFVQCLARLSILASAGGSIGQHAILRIARIQLVAQKRPEAASRTLSHLRASDDAKIEARKQKLLAAIETARLKHRT